MFVREKRIGPYTYVYMVETTREQSRVKQRIIANLGRKATPEICDSCCVVVAARQIRLTALPPAP